METLNEKQIHAPLVGSAASVASNFASSELFLKNTNVTSPSRLVGNYQQNYGETCDDAVHVQISVKSLQTADATPSGNQYPERPMQKVPPFLRLDRNHQQDYDPLVVSLGPYHHGKEELRAAEDFKPEALRMFVAGSGQDEDFFLSQVLEHIDYTRNCYIEDSTDKYNNAEFARMMLLDACFIINFILLTKGSRENILSTRRHLGDFVRETIFRDMLLLENQIPFKILMRLMYQRYGEQAGEKMLSEFLTMTVSGEWKGCEIASRNEELPLHLVEAFQRVLVGEYPDSTYYPTTTQGPQTGKEEDNGESMKKYIHSFRSATDLKARGIHFRPSTSDSLKDIKFIPGYFYALLEIPTCFVTYDTKVFFSNIIAYEFCPSANIDPVVTSYIEFMKLLIDNPKDVKELREKRILLTTLSSDEQVVKVYKEINTYGVCNVFTFHKMKKEIEAHYNNKAKTWLAELIYTNFRSPWTAIALFAATFLLVLTFLQTYYTIRPS